MGKCSYHISSLKNYMFRKKSSPRLLCCINASSPCFESCGCPCSLNSRELASGQKSDRLFARHKSNKSIFRKRNSFSKHVFKVKILINMPIKPKEKSCFTLTTIIFNIHIFAKVHRPKQLEFSSMLNLAIIFPFLV